MDNITRETLKVIVELSDYGCDRIAHMHGNATMNERGYRNGGSFPENASFLPELQELGLIKGPIADTWLEEGIGTFQLTQKGKDVAEVLFWLDNGEEYEEELQGTINNLRQQILFD